MMTSRIAENLADVRRRIADAAARSGRTAAEVTLVGVTKYVSADEIRELVGAGCTELGESRPQQLWDKAAALAGLPIRWHMIGHLQRNKVQRTVPVVEMIQSADSPRLVRAIDTAAVELARRLPILIEVNVSGEEAKHGFAPERVEPFLEEAAGCENAGCENIEIRGLMCMAGLGHGADAARRDFAVLRQLRDRLQRNCPEDIALSELSMGMSGDYEVAIEEGATIVRVGSVLFRGIL